MFQWIEILKCMNDKATRTKMSVNLNTWCSFPIALCGDGVMSTTNRRINLYEMITRLNQILNSFENIRPNKFIIHYTLPLPLCSHNPMDFIIVCRSKAILQNLKYFKLNLSDIRVFLDVIQYSIIELLIWFQIFVQPAFSTMIAIDHLITIAVHLIYTDHFDVWNRNIFSRAEKWLRKID